MDGAGLSGTEMLAWNQRTIDGWKALIARDAAVLDVPCDVYGVTDLRGLLRHIVAVELRYAQRLAGTAESPYEDIGLLPEEFFAMHDKAHALLQACIDNPAFDWSVKQEFVTISWGLVQSHRNTMFAHALLHGIRHLGQAAMLARQGGIQAGLGNGLPGYGCCEGDGVAMPLSDCYGATAFSTSRASGVD